MRYGYGERCWESLWSDKISNEDVLRRVGEERILMIILRGQRTWIGHTLRHGDLLVVMIEVE